MKELFEFLKKYFEEETIYKIRDIILIIVIGYISLQLIAYLVRRLIWKNLSKQSQMILNKAIIYSGFIIILFLVLKRLDIKLAGLLGAAGVVGIVLGIASQTSVGNIISGIFLVSEKTFEIGDLIRVGDKTGTVYSIDLLSVKLKTLDNLLIRIPNQTMISTEVTNITKFPIRRMDITVSVAYKEDLQKVMDILKQLVKENPACLDEPEPLIVIQQFGESSIDFTYGIWFEKSSYLKVRNSIMRQIKETFDAEGIEIPFPHRTIYTGEITKPFPVQLQEKE